MNQIIVTILAGGLGKRMNSEIPKVLHTIFNKPLLVHIIEQATQLNPKKILVVVGQYKDIIISELKKYIFLDNIEFVIQPQPLGTGNAIQCCKPYLYTETNSDTKVIILSGDVPLIKCSTIYNILNKCCKVSVVTTDLDEPKGYGRIIKNDGIFTKIVEEKDCNSHEKLINLVNCGIYAFDTNMLCKYIDKLTNNNSQNEYYLTDIIEIIRNNENIEIDTYHITKENQYEIMGINTTDDLRNLELSLI